MTHLSIFFTYHQGKVSCKSLTLFGKGWIMIAKICVMTDVVNEERKVLERCEIRHTTLNHLLIYITNCLHHNTSVPLSHIPCCQTVCCIDFTLGRCITCEPLQDPHFLGHCVYIKCGIIMIWSLVRGWMPNWKRWVQKIITNPPNECISIQWTPIFLLCA